MDLNIVTLVGRLAGKPSLKLYQKKDGTEGARTFFRLAVGRISDLGNKDRSARRTNFIGCVAWGNTAKIIAQYLDKGHEVALTGEFIAESRVIEGTNPVQYREFTHVLVNSVQFGRRPAKNGAAPTTMPSDAEGLKAAAAALLAKLSQSSAPAAASAEHNPFEGPQ